MKANELRKYFKKHKVKDCEIAKALNITRCAFSLKMSGKRDFTLENVRDIQKFFNMTDSEIVFYFIK